MAFSRVGASCSLASRRLISGFQSGMFAFPSPLYCLMQARLTHNAMRPAGLPSSPAAPERSKPARQHGLLQPLAQRVFVEEVLPGERFINDDHGRAVAVVLGSEEAAFDQCNAHRLEIIRTHGVALAESFLLGNWSAFNEESRVIDISSKRKSV